MEYRRGRTFARVPPPSRFPQTRIADHAQAASAATPRVAVVAIGWKPKGIARPQELLLINRTDLERAGDTQDELLGPDLGGAPTGNRLRAATRAQRSPSDAAALPSTASPPQAPTRTQRERPRPREGTWRVAAPPHPGALPATVPRPPLAAMGSLATDCQRPPQWSRG